MSENDYDGFRTHSFRRGVMEKFNSVILSRRIKSALAFNEVEKLTLIEILIDSLWSPFVLATLFLHEAGVFWPCKTQKTGGRNEKR